MLSTKDRDQETVSKEELEIKYQESMAALKTLTAHTKDMFRKSMDGAEVNKEEYEQLKEENSELKKQLETEENSHKLTKREWNKDKRKLTDKLEEANKNLAEREKELIGKLRRQKF